MEINVTTIDRYFFILFSKIKFYILFLYNIQKIIIYNFLGLRVIVKCVKKITPFLQLVTIVTYILLMTIK